MGEYTVDSRDREEMAEMLSDPRTWPLFPAMPVKSRIERTAMPEGCFGDGFPLCGVILLDEDTCNLGNPKRVYLLMYDELAGLTLNEARAKAEKDGLVRTYESVDALLAAGWVID